LKRANRRIKDHQPNDSTLEATVYEGQGTNDESICHKAKQNQDKERHIKRLFSPGEEYEQKDEDGDRYNYSSIVEPRYRTNWKFLRILP
jgi:hypothetical protein